ncbi:hypothetical protein FIBSPDRAFT_853102 [Athelia psychrophila]|uniref:Uncharacterized protein n=1 Tax=Athelia psychrophila TaxID=1759441 RepID=A0A166R577_9AGAM|nr:hypothetical protein FIBSPDRAFT_853102 [Fibularhizoctonia sp. CBS 109695]
MRDRIDSEQHLQTRRLAKSDRVSSSTSTQPAFHGIMYQFACTRMYLPGSRDPENPRALIVLTVLVMMLIWVAKIACPNSGCTPGPKRNMHAARSLIALH